MNQYYARKQWLVAVFEDTMSLISNDTTLQQAVSESIRSQQLITENTVIELPKPPYTQSAQVVVTKQRSLEAAASYVTEGLRTAVLNFASANSPGGGVQSGASAQEESLCRVSTLYPCLRDKRMWDLFYSPHRKTQNPLHNDDIIYTRDVVVVKDDDYNLLNEQFKVDIITCAAPNLREEPSNIYNPYDGTDGQYVSSEQLLRLHEQRGRKILGAAAQNGAEALILGAFGCGAFRNDPQIVARAYKNILPDYLHYFKTIEFAVWCRPTDESNYLAFCEAIENN